MPETLTIDKVREMMRSLPVEPAPLSIVRHKHTKEVVGHLRPGIRAGTLDFHPRNRDRKPFVITNVVEVLDDYEVLVIDDVPVVGSKFLPTPKFIPGTPHV